MEAKFSPRVKDVITYSREEALRLGHDQLGLDHLMLGIIREGEGSAVKILKSLNVNILDLRKVIEEFQLPGNRRVNSLAEIPLLKQTEKALKVTYLEAKLHNSERIGTEHLLLAILKDNNNLATKALNKFNVDYETVTRVMEDQVPNIKAEKSSTSDDEGEEEGGGAGFGSGTKKAADSKSKTPVLDNFGRDLTKSAEEGKLDPIVGREKEIERVSQILSRRKKNNPILIGEPGVGKSAIAEGLALRIIQRKVSRVLFNKRVVTLDLASLVAGTKYRGQFE